MTESSGPWDNSSFAEDEWRALFRSLTNGRLKAGIANSLEITRSASDRNVTISAGKAILQGMLYENTADVVFSIAVPSGSNQRVDYIILKYDTSQSLANRIVLAVKQGAEALSGAIPPALTQSETGVWEHPLAVIGPYGSGVISAAPFAELSPVASRRFYVPIGSYADPNSMPGLAANFRDEAFDANGRVWSLNSSGIWELANAAAGLPNHAESSSDFNTTALWGAFSANTTLGFAFVVPPSGKFYVTVSAQIVSSQNTRGGIVSYEIRTGSSVGAGAISVAASSDRSVQSPQAVTTGGPARINASQRRLFTGFPPGDAYNIRCMQSHLVGPVAVQYRYILVEPVT